MSDFAINIETQLGPEFAGFEDPADDPLKKHTALLYLAMNDISKSRGFAETIVDPSLRGKTYSDIFEVSGDNEDSRKALETTEILEGR